MSAIQYSLDETGQYLVAKIDLWSPDTVIREATTKAADGEKIGNGKYFANVVDTGFMPSQPRLTNGKLLTLADEGDQSGENRWQAGDHPVKVKILVSVDLSATDKPAATGGWKPRIAAPAAPAQQGKKK